MVMVMVTAGRRGKWKCIIRGLYFSEQSCFCFLLFFFFFLVSFIFGSISSLSHQWKPRYLYTLLALLVCFDGLSLHLGGLKAKDEKYTQPYIESISNPACITCGSVSNRVALVIPKCHLGSVS